MKRPARAKLPVLVESDDDEPRQDTPRQLLEESQEVFNVLYLFAGAERKCDVAECLKSLCANKPRKINCENIDLLRNRKHDVLEPEFRSRLRQRVQKKEFDVVVVTPPCNTHSRARNANVFGPPPIRSQRWPMGFPWLQGSNLKAANLSNDLLEFTWEICRDADVAGVPWVKEHPEDLGQTRNGDHPASIWSTEQELALCKDTTHRPEAQTAALFQCPFGAKTSKPTRITATLPLLDPPKPAKLYRGWPAFTRQGQYKGPLPVSGCGHKNHPQLLKRKPDGSFRTSAAAAYPPLMCHWLALLILTWCLTKPKGRGGKLLQSGDSETDVEMPTLIDKPNTPVRMPLEMSDAEATDGDTRGSTSEEDEPGIPKPRAIHHKGGMGPPMETVWGGNRRAFHDGAGLCSPGRWPPSRRKCYTWKGIFHIRQAWLTILRKEIPDIKRLVFTMACGRVLENPFKPEVIHAARLAWAEILHGSSSEPPFSVAQLMEIQEHQPFVLRSISETLRLLKDPDWRIMCTASKGNFEKGVPVGVGVKLPRTPAVYERKHRWKKLDETEYERDMPNYKSAAGTEMSKILRSQFLEEQDLGMMYETTLRQAEHDYPGDALRIAAQGAIEKADETFRILHDGTHGVRVNNEIKVRDQTRMPGASEGRSVMNLCYEKKPGVHFQLLSDVKKAHRRYLHRVQDHGLQACRAETPEDPTSPDSKIWINRTGTFGVGCAGYWWGRLAAACGRIVIALFFEGHWYFQLIYADDIRSQSHGPESYESLLLGIFAWVVMGTPLSWKKLRGGLKIDWIGYYLDYTRFEIGINEARAVWLINWMGKILADGLVHMRSMAQGLGRLGFSSGVLEWCRPFLAPIYSWVSAAPESAILTIPPLIRLTLTWINSQLQSGRRTTPCRGPMENLGEIFRTDAKADVDYVRLGGWESAGGDPSKARWFSTTISKADAPWLFERGHGSRTVSSSELMATLVAVGVFCDAPKSDSPRRALMRCTGLTDNQGNQFVVRRLMTTKFPLCAVLMQLTSTLADRSLWLDLEWTPRESNIEADALTNNDFTGFDPALRIPVDWDSFPKKVLEDVLAAGLGFEKSIKDMRERQKSLPTLRKRKRKVPEVWG